MYFCGSFTQGSTGNKSVAGLGFQPSYLRFTVSQKFNTPENNVAHLSTGFTDGTRQLCHSTLADTTGNHTRVDKNNCVTHYIRSGSTLVKNIEASFVSFDVDGFTLNFTSADPNFQIFVEAMA